MCPFNRAFIGLILAVVLIIFTLPVQAEGSDLYFIVGSPDINYEVAFPVILLKLNNKGGLESVREVVSGQIGAVGIRAYYDERVIVAKSKIYGTSERTSKFSIIDMDKPLEEKQFEWKYPRELTDIGSFLFDVSEGAIYQGMELYRVSGDLERFIGFNLMTLKEEKLSLEVYKFIVLGGKAGGGTPDRDLFIAMMDDKNNLVMPRGGKRVVTQWTLPKSIQYKKKKLITIYVNNNDVLAIAPLDEREKETNGLGLTTFYILNKKNDKWHQFKIKGDYTGMRGFGIWLAGYVSSKDKSKVSPGKDKRRKNPTKTGMPADYWFDYFKEYAPGSLFIYNSDTQKKYEIETGQGDSEVLLVEGDYVYYRVYDEIYKAKIGKNKLEEPVLLVKDDAVPDIHWAFFGPKVDIPPQVQTTE